MQNGSPECWYLGTAALPTKPAGVLAFLQDTKVGEFVSSEAPGWGRRVEDADPEEEEEEEEEGLP